MCEVEYTSDSAEESKVFFSTGSTKMKIGDSQKCKSCQSYEDIID